MPTSTGLGALMAILTAPAVAAADVDTVVQTGTEPAAVPAYAHTGGAGGSAVAWNPTPLVSISITARPSTRTGTVTHQVA